MPPTLPCEARRIAHAIRRRALEHTISSNGGYLSQAASSAEILATLYTRIMHLGLSVAPPVPPPFSGAPGPGQPHVTGAGYNGPKGPAYDRFIVTAGSLGQALSQAAGIAFARKRRGDTAEGEDKFEGRFLYVGEVIRFVGLKPRTVIVDLNVFEELDSLGRESVKQHGNS